MADYPEPITVAAPPATMQIENYA